MEKLCLRLLECFATQQHDSSPYLTFCSRLDEPVKRSCSQWIAAVPAPLAWTFYFVNESKIKKRNHYTYQMRHCRFLMIRLGSWENVFMCVCVQVFGCQLTVEKSFRGKLSLWSEMRTPDTDSSSVRRWLTAEMFNRDETEMGWRRHI